MNPATMKNYLGKPVEALPTPALVVDLDALEDNLRLLAAYFAQRPAKLRPPLQVAQMRHPGQAQLENGSAVGITCAKLAEAEVLVAVASRTC